MLVSVFVLSLAFAAQDPPPPPAPLDDVTAPAADEPAADPVAVESPVVVPPPPPPPTVVPPPPPPAASTTARRSAPAPDARPEGMDTVPAAAAQVGAGVAGCCVGICVAAPCAFVPIVGGVLASATVGAVIGATEGVVGDAISQKRSALLWSVLAGSGIMVVGGLANLAVTYAVGLGGLALDPTAAFTGPAAIASLGLSLTTLVLALVVPAVVYHVMGVDKEPGDRGGLGMPGITSPADPTGTRGQSASPSSPSSPPPPSTPPPAYGGY